MQAFRVLWHALRQVLGNLRQALMLSVVPLVVGLGVAAGMIMVRQHWTRSPGLGGGGLVTALLAYLLVMAWLAVRWHRYILLDEHENLFAPPSRAAFWRYVGAMLRIVLVIVLVLLAALPMLYVISRTGSWVLAIFIAVVMNLLFFGLTLILGAALAGAAIGAHRPIRTAWERLKPAGGTLLVLSLLALAGNEAVEALLKAAASSGLPGVFKVIVIACCSWLSLLIGLSVLTTLWGHYVEDRPLR